MKAAETRLGPLLGGPGQFVVPHFQRAYSWRRQQWATLWADILELYELGTSQPHFMGSVVLLNEGTEGGTRLIIDGQQRLVTLSLFLAAMRDLAGETEIAAEIHHRYLLDEASVGPPLPLGEGWGEGLATSREDSEQPSPQPSPRGRGGLAVGDSLKLQCSYGDHAAFAALVERSEGTLGSPVAEAYDTFRSDLAEKLAEGLDLERLAAVILGQLAFVAISLDAEDNPYRVFESLNAKGMPLTQGDLLRNYFFMRLPADEHDHWFRAVWQPMQTRLGEALDAFMHDYLAKDGQDVRAEEVYQTWRKRLASEGVETVKAVLQDLAAWSVEYDALLHLNREPDTEPRRRLEWLSAWSATLRQPLLPFLLLVQSDYRRHALSEADAAVVLRAVQSYLARRVFTTSADEDDTQQLVALYSRAAGSNNRADAFVTALSNPALGWPTDDELRTAMLTYRLYPRSHADQRALLLIALEESYDRPMRMRAGDFDLELIVPLLPRPEWLAELGGDEELHWSVVGTIGNLTWVERGQSSRLPLSPAERKPFMRRQARRCPALARAVPLDAPWTAEAIRQRSADLAERMIRIWPGPRR